MIEALTAKLEIAKRDCESIRDGNWDDLDVHLAAAGMIKYLDTGLKLAKEGGKG